MNIKVTSVVISIVLSLILLAVFANLPYDSQIFIRIDSRRISFLAEGKIDNIFNFPILTIEEVNFKSFEKISVKENDKTFVFVPSENNPYNAIVAFQKGNVGPLNIAENTEITINTVGDLSNFFRVELRKHDSDILFLGDNIEMSGEGLALSPNQEGEIKENFYNNFISKTIDEAEIIPLNNNLEINIYSSGDNKLGHTNPFFVRGLIFQEDNSDIIGNTSSIIKGEVTNSLTHKTFQLTEDNKFLDFEEEQTLIIRNFFIIKDTIILDLKVSSENLPKDFKESKVLRTSFLDYFWQRHFVTFIACLLIFLITVPFFVFFIFTFFNKRNRNRKVKIEKLKVPSSGLRSNNIIFPIKPKIFISYSHKDEEWKNRLVTHLNVLEKQEFLETWDDRRIKAGELWQPEIEKAIESAQVAILLISANFLTSNFILQKEIPRLLEKQQADGTKIFPLIIKPCTWSAVDWLNPIQARPKDGLALSGGNEHQIDTALTKFAIEILGIINSSENKK